MSLKPKLLADDDTDFLPPATPDDNNKYDSETASNGANSLRESRNKPVNGFDLHGNSPKRTHNTPMPL